MTDFKISKNGVLTKYNGTDGTITIPDTVKSIGECAFRGCLHLQHVTIPANVTRIGSRAFQDCTNLENIVIAPGTTYIGEMAFDGCSSLQSISIPETVQSIGPSAFNSCKSLQNITIPDSVTKLGNGAFAWCISLKSVTIGSGITTLEECLFYECSNLQNIPIPDTVTKIYTHVFYNCSGLQTLFIPNSVTSLSKNAFPATIPKIVLAPTSQNVEQSKHILSMFGAENLALPFLLGRLETNETIRKNLQNTVTSKKSREKYIPTLIEMQETEVFIRLLSILKKMSLEEIDTYIRLSVEKNTVEITSRLMEYKQKHYPPEKIEELQETQFEKEFGLREKTLTDYRKDFKIFKAENCYKITGYKSQNPDVVIPGNIRGIPVQIYKNAFGENDNIKTVYIEDGVTEIGKFAFWFCRNLKSITIPESVTNIGEKAFVLCEKITISAPSGSYAQTYAKDNQIKFFPK